MLQLGFLIAFYAILLMITGPNFQSKVNKQNKKKLETALVVLAYIVLILWLLTCLTFPIIIFAMMMGPIYMIPLLLLVMITMITPVVIAIFVISGKYIQYRKFIIFAVWMHIASALFIMTSGAQIVLRRGLDRMIMDYHFLIQNMVSYVYPPPYKKSSSPLSKILSKKKKLKKST